jgi:hypothetical protein
MGLIVFFINLDHGWGPATTAALKQAGYTFLLGGVIIKILETIALKIGPRYMAIIISTIVTSLLTITLVYLVHSMRGTPKPFESTLPTILMAPPGFLALAIRTRRKS